MNLKFHLLINIALVGLLCLIGTAAFVLYRADREVRLAVRVTADSIDRQLEFQRLRIDTGFEKAERFPDLSLWKETRNTPGICVQFVSANRKTTRTVCQGAELPPEKWPGWFEGLYRSAFNSGYPQNRTITYQNRTYGYLSVTPNAQMELARAWQSLSAMLKLSATTIFSVCLLVYLSIDRTLRPARAIVSALNKMHAGDLSVRLPKFDILEWQYTGTAINELAAAQQQLLSERRTLSAKLVELQEAERTYLARELHDESGQCLAASNAVATSILQTAKTECPNLVADAESILRINRKILDGVHAMLKRLRPADLDELELSTCLKSMVSEWNARSGAKARYRLEIDGNCDNLPEPLPVTVYRIVQECLTNIARHSNAARVDISLKATNRHVDLVIQDDGSPANTTQSEESGAGLAGMRERVQALGGNLYVESPSSGGFIVRATIPLNALELSQP